MIGPAGPTLYVGGQNGTDGTGALLDGLEAQTEQAMRNVLAVLAEAGTDPEHVAKLTIYLAPKSTQCRPMPQPARSVRPPRVVTVLAVAPARPGALVEIEAVATLPDH
jgi:2-iminobutanoate/2-iminopropanoate deaminase